MTLHEMTLFENRPLPCISLTFRKMRKNNKLDCWYITQKREALWTSLITILRRDGDSNPGTALDGYTLSRRASSATRASLLVWLTTLSMRLNTVFFKRECKVSTFWAKAEGSRRNLKFFND